MKSIKILILLIVLTIVFLVPIQAQDKDTISTATYLNPDTITQGMMGSVNPMNANNPVLTGDELLDESFPGSWPLFGADTRLKIGGYVKGDLIHDFDYIGDRYEFELGSIAVDGSPEQELGGITTFHAKESRVNLDFRSKAKWKNGKEFPVKIYVEIDWFFDSESLSLNTRLRQAYGVIGRLLVGQTWSTTTDLSAIPSLIDFASGDALYGGRFTQIRWQDNITDHLSYAVALEDPGGQIDNPQNLDGAFRPLYPNFAAMIRYKSTIGSTLQFGLDAFPLSWKGPDTVPNESSTGYAITLMSRIIFKIKDNKDAFTWGGGYGHGQGYRIVALLWDGKASGVIDNTGLTVAPSWFAYAGYNHYWTKNLNSNISTYWTGTELTDTQSENTIQGAGAVHLNLIYFPFKRISVGAEYMWGMRENRNKVQGTANRLQLMAKFLFN